MPIQLKIDSRIQAWLQEHPRNNAVLESVQQKISEAEKAGKLKFKDLQDIVFDGLSADDVQLFIPLLSTVLYEQIQKNHLHIDSDTLKFLAEKSKEFENSFR